MSNNKFILLSALAVGIVGASATPDAQALTRWLNVNGSGACQSALPVFDVQIRKRPLAVQNEGTTPAYITCSFYTMGPFSSSVIRVNARVHDGVADTLTCTGVNGYAGGKAVYLVKNFSLPADGSLQEMQWSPAEFNGPDAFDPNAFDLYNFGISCNLNPGVGIGSIEIFYEDGV